MKPSPADAAVLLARIEENSAKTEQTMRSDLDSALADSDPLLVEVLSYALFSGGKRLRPLLTAISSRLCGRNDQGLLLLAAAFEYLHVATLIHDDVIDRADSRRGRKSVVRQHGLAAAILAGDWLHARSMHLIGSLAGPQGLEVFCAATANMVDGEFRQMRHVADREASEEQYLGVVVRKTAGLISSACAVGALYAQGTPVQIAALKAYGMKLGIAFQIADDLLDYLGDEQSTGKKIGNDFIEGKMTLPLIHALEHAKGEDGAHLLRCIRGDRSLGEACDEVKQLMRRTGSFDYARQRAELEIEEGLTALACFDQEQHRKSIVVLKALAKHALCRDR